MCQRTIHRLPRHGKLYNWYAVNDSRGLCPAGWHVPGDTDWTQLENYVVSRGYPNRNIVNSAGNVFKSCRREGSIKGGDCNTSEHPRWVSHETEHHGLDEFGYAALPGGNRQSFGSSGGIGRFGDWWSSTEASPEDAWYRGLIYLNSVLLRYHLHKSSGFGVRCIRSN